MILTRGHADLEIGRGFRWSRARLPIDQRTTKSWLGPHGIHVWLALGDKWGVMITACYDCGAVYHFLHRHSRRL